MRCVIVCIAAILCVFPQSASADEGMWTFNKFPSGSVGKLYGFTPSAGWLDHVRLASVRIAGGCSSSFVSSQGLVMTNHHCAVDCVDQLSTQKRNFVETGFYAKTAAEEVKCPDFELNSLTDIQDVTVQVQNATRGLVGEAYNAAVRAENASLQKACATNPTIRCDVVALYHGGIYNLYKYKRYRDVRLVFAPEFSVAQFGGDPDNFNFPRYDYDISLLRAYENDRPASTPEYLRWSAKGSRENELVFVSGNPGSTSRELTVAQLEYLRDHAFPRTLSNLAELRGVLEQYGKAGGEAARTTRDELFFVENSYKADTGRQQALQDKAFFAKLVRKEDALRRRVASRASLERRYGNAWNQMAGVQRTKNALALAFAYIGSGRGLETELFNIAQTLVRLPVEKQKPNGKRLPEYSDAALVTLPYRLFSQAPIYASVEELNLAFSLKKMREDLGTDHPFVRQVLGRSSPDQRAHQLISGTQLIDVKARRALYDGGAAAIAASNDPLIVLARDIDAQARAVRKQYEDTVAAPERKASEDVARARFAIEGTSVYPDATFTLRLSYGTVKGFPETTGYVAPYTTIDGLFKRATGADPYVLPQSWLTAKPSLDSKTAMNLATTNDIIGGNSGSPLINKNAEVVGLIFDGNIHSLGGDFGFEPAANRAIAVDSRALLAGLQHVYHADRIVSELLNR